MIVGHEFLIGDAFSAACYSAAVRVVSMPRKQSRLQIKVAVLSKQGVTGRFDRSDERTAKRRERMYNCRLRALERCVCFHADKVYFCSSFLGDSAAVRTVAIAALPAGGLV